MGAFWEMLLFPVGKCNVQEDAGTIVMELPERCIVPPVRQATSSIRLMLDYYQGRNRF